MKMDIHVCFFSITNKPLKPPMAVKEFKQEGKELQGQSVIFFEVIFFKMFCQIQLTGAIEMHVVLVISQILKCSFH